MPPFNDNLTPGGQVRVAWKDMAPEEGVYRGWHPLPERCAILMRGGHIVWVNRSIITPIEDATT